MFSEFLKIKALEFGAGSVALVLLFLSAPGDFLPATTPRSALVLVGNGVFIAIMYFLPFGYSAISTLSFVLLRLVFRRGLEAKRRALIMSGVFLLHAEAIALWSGVSTPLFQVFIGAMAFVSFFLHRRIRVPRG